MNHFLEPHCRRELESLLSKAINPDDVATLAFAGVIATRSMRKPPYDVPIAGLDESGLAVLRERYFPGANLEFFSVPTITEVAANRFDEFDDLLGLLLAGRAFDNEESRWVAHAVATASMADNHLWQDMGLPNRAALSELLTRYFTPLAQLNVNDMKWKKFFYRQLCDRSGISICRAPSCAVCGDYQHCFAPEE